VLADSVSLSFCVYMYMCRHSVQVFNASAFRYWVAPFFCRALPSVFFSFYLL
jgi:hypothetical protein